MEGSESRTHELGFYHEGSGQPADSQPRGTVIPAFWNDHSDPGWRMNWREQESGATPTLFITVTLASSRAPAHTERLHSVNVCGTNDWKQRRLLQ